MFCRPADGKECCGAGHQTFVHAKTPLPLLPKCTYRERAETDHGGPGSCPPPGPYLANQGQHRCHRSTHIFVIGKAVKTSRVFQSSDRAYKAWVIHPPSPEEILSRDPIPTTMSQLQEFEEAAHDLFLTQVSTYFSEPSLTFVSKKLIVFLLSVSLVRVKRVCSE